MTITTITTALIDAACAGDPNATTLIHQAITTAARQAAATSPTIDAGDLVSDIWIELTKVTADPVPLTAITRRVLNRVRSDQQAAGVVSASSVRSGADLATATIGAAATGAATVRYLAGTVGRPALVDVTEPVGPHTGWVADRGRSAEDVALNVAEGAGPVERSLTDALVERGFTREGAARFAQTLIDAGASAAPADDAIVTHRQSLAVVRWHAEHGPEHLRPGYQGVLARNTTAPHVAGLDRVVGRLTTAGEVQARLAGVTRDEWVAASRALPAVVLAFAAGHPDPASAPAAARALDELDRRTLAA